MKSLVALFTLLAGAANAQTTFASITGTVATGPAAGQKLSTAGTCQDEREEMGHLRIVSRNFSRTRGG